MKFLFLVFLFTCAFYYTKAQVNYVKNPDFEQYYHCPSDWDQIDSCMYWKTVIASPTFYDCIPEYCNACAVSNPYCGIPANLFFYQYPRSGSGMVQMKMYNDKISPPPSPPLKEYNRDYLNGELYTSLDAGVSYCVTFYVVLEESSQYAINRIGAYLNNGHLDTVSNICEPITSVSPQVYATSIISDTFNWVKIEGTFIATGNEKFITIGNFFDKSSTAAIISSASGLHFSWYLVDDVSVIETDLPADAGPDKWVPVGDSVFIGRGMDSTKGLDCKWYHKGIFVDSGAGIFVHATTVGAVDTYAVVQTICGLVKTDTVLVLTASMGIGEVHSYGQKLYELFPNPTKGQVTIRQTKAMYSQVLATIYDVYGRQVFQGHLKFEDGLGNLSLQSLDKGVYVIQLYNPTGSVSRLQLLID